MLLCQNRLLALRLVVLMLVADLLPLGLHLRDAIEEFLQENLNLTGLPKIRSKTLQVNLHVMDFIRDAQVLVEIQKADHCAQGLLEFTSFLLESGNALLRQVSAGPLVNDALLRLLHVVHAFLHLPLDHDEAFLEKHDIIVMGRARVLTNLLDAHSAQRLVLCDAQVLYFLLVILTDGQVEVTELIFAIQHLSGLGRLKSTLALQVM